MKDGTPSGSTEFLRLLSPDNEADADAQYRALRGRLCGFFRLSGCEDPEELADVTLSECVTSLTRGKVVETTLSAYVYGIAKHVLSGYRKRLTQSTTVQLDDNVANVALDAARVTEARITLRQTLRHLTREERRMVVRYFSGTARTTVAQEFGLSPGALRVRVFRIRQRLRKDARETPQKRIAPERPPDTEEGVRG